MNQSVSLSEYDAIALGAPDEGERARYIRSLAAFEDIHLSLSTRAAATPERRALEGLDAALALVTPAGKPNRRVDAAAFAALRGSIEAVARRTPEARALDLFEDALKGMMASAADFDDLPDDEVEAAADMPDETAAAEEALAGEVVVAEDAAPADEVAPAEEAAQADEVAPLGAHAADASEAESGFGRSASPATTEAAADEEQSDITPPAEPLEASYESGGADRPSADPEDEVGSAAAGPDENAPFEAAANDAEPDTAAELSDEDVKRRIADLEAELALTRAALAD